MGDFIVRQATEHDSRFIIALIHAVQINPTGLDWNRFMVAMTLDGVLAGCGQIKIHSDGSRELASLAVKEEFRGQGLARRIIERLVDGKPRPIFLMCRSRLGSLFQKFGFVPVEWDEMTPYFRRIYHLARIAGLIIRKGDKLLVMRLD